MASDSPPTGRPTGRRTGSQGFVWVSSSPSPAEVAALEASFPEIVQVPARALEAESSDWQRRALLMRTFHRWIPADAFLREFRRAGIAGDITHLSLAFRCHIFCFSDEAARDRVLNRPWTINGQPVAAEGWMPEFIPAADAIPSALLWIRLPNLPIEFWKVDCLREIVGPAGEFVSADDATLAQNRGGFARVCVKVDLRSPLRPGTRLRGLHGPFWQQFAFENLEGICNACGSLHLSGACSSPDVVDAGSPSSGCHFGPWMSVLRQRLPIPGPQASSRGPRHPVPVTVSGGSQSAASPSSTAPGSVVADPMAAQLLSRRRGRRRSETGKSKTDAEGFIAVPVTFNASGPSTVARRAVSATVAPVKEPAAAGNPIPGPIASLVSIQLASNPFAALSDAPDGTLPPGSRDACPGPLKRARPTDYQAPRSIPKKGTQKGKGSFQSPKATKAMTTSPDPKTDAPGSSSGCSPADHEAMQIQAPKTVNSTKDQAVMVTQDQKPAPMLSDPCYQSTEPQLLIESSHQLSENDMVEDREITLVPHSVK